MPARKYASIFRLLKFIKTVIIKNRNCNSLFFLSFYAAMINVKNFMGNITMQISGANFENTSKEVKTVNKIVMNSVIRILVVRIKMENIHKQNKPWIEIKMVIIII